MEKTLLALLLAMPFIVAAGLALGMYGQSTMILFASLSADGGDLVAHQLSQRACVYRAGFRVSVPNATIKLP